MAHTSCYEFTTAVLYWRGARDVLVRIYDDAEQYRQEALLSRERDRFREEIHTDRVDWFGRDDLDSWDDAVRLSTEPWPEGIDRVHRFAEQLKAELPKPQDRRRRRRWDDRDGDDVCYDRLRSGQAFWRRTERRWSSAPQSVAIMVDVGTTANYSTKQMVWRGVTAMAVAHVLEAAGFTAEVWSVNYTSWGDTTRLLQAVRLKPAAQALDEGLLSNVLSPWYYRSLTFQTRYSTRGPHGNNTAGTSSTPSQAMLNLVRPTAPDTAQLFLADLWSHDEALDAARDFLQAFGGELEAWYEEAS